MLVKNANDRERAYIVYDVKLHPLVIIRLVPSQKSHFLFSGTASLNKDKQDLIKRRGDLFSIHAIRYQFEQKSRKCSIYT